MILRKVENTNCTGLMPISSKAPRNIIKPMFTFSIIIRGRHCKGIKFKTLQKLVYNENDIVNKFKVTLNL
jgi:hypothetical protein